MIFIAKAPTAEDELAAMRAALDVAERRAAGSTQRMLDALRTAGAARDDISRMAEEFVWLRGLVAEAKAAADASRADATWMRRQSEAAQADAEDRLKQLLARADEVGWLRGCLADAEARVAAAEARAAAELRLRAEAEARAQSRAAELAAIRASISWRVTAPLRRMRGAVPKPAPEAAPPTPPPAPPEPSQAVIPAAVIPAAPVPPRPAQAPTQVQAAVPEPPPVPSPPLPRAPAPPAPSPRRPSVGVVHQFHAGSAQGDAITNAMLLIRSRLRAAGFRSDIFVEHRGPGLGQDIRLLDSMPEHDGYVLLCHHSMGFSGFDAVMTRPARKVLIYHNITPPELLGAIPRIQHLAQIGREQLATLRGHVEASLADSDYNAVELHRLGFRAVRTCPLLFDVEQLTSRASGKQGGDGVFTVLFAGRVTPSKSQDALVDAFAAFRTRFGLPCRLVLVGALDPDEHVFIGMVQTRIAEAGLEGCVHLTGLVSDAELHDWFAQADLYVSLSRHEGFGVPLVEAMAYGVPVLAWPTGAVPFTLGEAGVLLSSRDPGAVAEAMMAAVANREALVARGTRSIERWSLNRQWPVLMEALATAGATPPHDPASIEAVAANLQVTICGHVAKTYSLAAVNRGLARTLEARRPGTVRIVPVEGAPTADLHEVPAAERGFVAMLAARGPAETGPVLVLSGHYPLHVPAQRGDLSAALFFWEESLIPQDMVATLNGSFGAVFAPSRTVAKALVDSGVRVPVLNLGHAPDLARFAALQLGRDRPGPFTFLHVSSAFPRKGLDVLLAAWVQAFTAADPVRLVVKAVPNPHNDAAAQITQVRAQSPDCASIELVDEESPPDALLALYRGAGAMVLPTRGEGFNLPAAEAMAAGVPLIVTAHGGHMDFCQPSTARLVQRRFAPSSSHLAPPHSLWAEPDASDLADALREAASGALAPLAEPARRHITAWTEPAAFTARLTQAAARLLLAPVAAPMRLTVVSSWGVRCGVAEYTRALLEALPREGLAEPVILADDRTAPGGAVRNAWRAGDGGDVDRLVAAVERADGDVTLIQHQAGLIPWRALAQLLDVLAEAGRSTVVTLHATAQLLALDQADRGAVASGLGRASRLLVHTLADIEVLDRLGLSAVTALLPHGAPAPATAQIRPLPEDAAPVIGCTGFFLPDKGIPALIAATARLRGRWPEVRLRLVNAEYGHPISSAEISNCRRLAEAEGLAVEWHTGFVTLAEQHALLRGCDLVVLPYQRSQEGSSAALRSALATGIPVAVTPLPVFDEAAGAVFRLPGTEPAPIALGMANLLGNPGRRADLADSARAWMADRALPGVARRLHGMLLGLAAQARMGQPADGSLWQPGA